MCVSSIVENRLSTRSLGAGVKSFGLKENELVGVNCAIMICIRQGVGVRDLPLILCASLVIIFEFFLSLSSDLHRSIVLVKNCPAHHSLP